MDAFVISQAIILLYFSDVPMFQTDYTELPVRYFLCIYICPLWLIPALPA